MRTMTALAVSTGTSGRCTELALMVADIDIGRVDPAFLASSMPVTSLAQAIWENLLDRNEYTRAMQATLEKYEHTYSWRAVKGPLATAYTSVRRIGGSFLDPF